MKIFSQISSTLLISGIGMAISISTAHASTPQNKKVSSPIHHFIVVCQENHSFDNYFGTYPNAPGFIPLPETPQVNGIPLNTFNLDLSGNRIYPFTLSAEQAQTVDLNHCYHNQIDAFDNGKMDQFVYENQLFHGNLEYSTPLPMGHYDYNTIGSYWDYTQHFAMADNWFQPVFGPTTPNVLYLVSAQSGTLNQPVTYTSTPGNIELTYPTIGDELNTHQVSWSWYQGDWYTSRDQIMDNPFMFFKNYRLGYYRKNIKDLSEFSADLKNHRLPEISFIKPDDLDEHPGSDITKGMNNTVHIINNVMNSPYWQDTAIVVVYDECGGFWDHVNPPQFLSNLDGLRGDGPRIPAIVISPYAKMNYVSHVQFDTTSILHFIEWNWSLPALNSKDANANNLLDFFDFNHPDFDRFLIQTQAKHKKSQADFNIMINNFHYAKTSNHAPFIQNGILYMPFLDFARNFNILPIHTSQGYVFSWEGKRVTIPATGHVIQVDQEPIQLDFPIITQKKASTSYIPVETIAQVLGIEELKKSPTDITLIAK